MDTARTPRDEAAEYIANRRFHQSVTLPARDGHKKMLISYAEYGYEGDANTPTILFTPGMFGSRYVGMFMHAIAAKNKVRVLVPDRFGFGETKNVPLESRISAWTAAMPRFLEALGIKHVALLSHSAGTIYNLNLLWHHREVLHPTRPMIFFLAPFVDVAHSKVPMVLALQKLPEMSFGYWNKMASFFALKASVMVGFSSGLLAQFAGALSPGNDEPSAREANMKVIERDYGLGVDLQVVLEMAVTRGLFAEDTVGANHEALVCLKKGSGAFWAEADDMAVLIDKLAVRERETRVEGRAALRVGIFFAETDAMTGKTGQEYFQSCWKGENGQYEGCFDVKIKTIDKSDHDSVLRAAEALVDVIESVAEVGMQGGSIE
ncbi:Alpha/Beta hydrolase protein [Emericellopsis atlantica]|uniref:Alpha/Beta hydrolase protein n=1 Tax=Emericellopsis atlantica TaxID=2614577 RepID=A0A9P8CQA2_9HYPO|nr:Alpha/Beta hydrolase protein [Emericellopsis atlantica]KAG9255102.1 Alpha/Beta hydrolase protein [Emericellopsis atlantica]